MSTSALKDYFGLPGVKDLPSKARLLFAKAIKAEEDGRPDEAEACLNKAIQEEQAALATG